MDSPESKAIKQLQTDLIYLAKRCKIIEDAFLLSEEKNAELATALSDWSKGVKNQLEFMFNEFASLFITIQKNKKSFEYFRSTLRETHKQNYEKMEGILSRVNSLFDKKKKGLAIE